VFWIVEMKAPAPAVMAVALMVALMASLGWYWPSTWSWSAMLTVEEEGERGGTEGCNSRSSSVLLLLFLEVGGRLGTPSSRRGADHKEDVLYSTCTKHLCVRMMYLPHSVVDEAAKR